MCDILDNVRARGNKGNVSGGGGRRNTSENHYRGRFDNTVLLMEGDRQGGV